MPVVDHPAKDTGTSTGDGRASSAYSLPFRSGANTPGQYVAIATMVNTPADFSDIPLLAAISETTESKVSPGSNSIGQTDWPAAVVLTGWV